MPKVSAEKRTQMREHIFNTNDKNSVMQAAVATLQDSDFIVEDYNQDLGYIRATKTFKSNYVNKKRVAGWTTVLAIATAYTVFSYGATAASMYSPSRRIATEMKDKTVVVNASVIVEQKNPQQVSVKFLPVAKILQNADGFAFTTSAPMRVFRFYRPKLYDEFFAQVGEKLYY